MKTPFKEMTLVRLRSAIKTLERLIEEKTAEGNLRQAQKYRSDLNTALYWENIRRDEIAQQSPKEIKAKIKELKQRFEGLMINRYEHVAFNQFISDLRQYLQNR